MSCRNALLFLDCLRDSYKMAEDFDARPGLKFLIQKVVRAEVAANMYKQAGVSLTFYIHCLLEISARQENISVENTKRILLSEEKRRKIQEKYPSSEPASEASSDSEYEAGLDLENEELDKKKDPDLELAQASKGGMSEFVHVFVRLLKSIFDEVCVNYVDLYLDREGPNAADRLSGQMLVFLLIEPDDIPTLKREKSLKEMVAEKLRKQRKESEEKKTGLGETPGDAADPVGGTILPPLSPAVIAVQGETFAIHAIQEPVMEVQVLKMQNPWD